MSFRSLLRRIGPCVVSAGLFLCWACALPPRSSEELMMAARTGRTAETRRDALLEIKGRAPVGLREDVEAVLRDELDPGIRALAAEVLARMGDLAAANELRTAVRQDAHWLVREKALRALATLQRSAVGPELERVLRQEPEPRIRVAALYLARVHLGGQATPLLLKGLTDERTVVRLEARNLLQELTGQSAPPDREQWEALLKQE